jgi:hypothetical protein
MPWEDEHGLSTRINTPRVPLIVCGPILRRTEPDSVTVWVALKEPRTVTLRVYLRGVGGNLTQKFVGTRATVRLGEHLHVVAITAKAASSQQALLPGQLYCYNLFFFAGTVDPVPESGDNLNTSGILNPTGASAPLTLAYASLPLPSFALPPTDLNNVRIIHGSCRKPHGEARDAFMALDGMIHTTAEAPNKRPHQLFLTGDQIYADDVADALLMALTEAGDTLLGWPNPEKLPDVNKTAKELQPGRRSEISRTHCGFSSTADKSHLFSFGEFCAMYLFAWSDAVWSRLPEFEDVYKGVNKTTVIVRNKNVVIVGTPQFVTFEMEAARLRLFFETLSRVRRALANVPTYMIFDDHEITDDWYLNRSWCNRALAKPLGRRVIQNGLLAYALFQHWGNTPGRFESGTPGMALLDAAEAWAQSGGTDDSKRGEIATRIGLPPAPPETSTELSPPQGALEWHYGVSGPAHQVLVLDSRTRRSYPGADIDQPVLLSTAAFQRQVSRVPAPGQDGVTLVISPAPVVGIPFIENHQRKAQTLEERLDADTEAWSLQKTGFESLLAALASRAPLSPTGNRRARVVFLSGDVHYGYAARLRFWATAPFNDPQPVQTDAVFAQLTSSSLKNETSGGLLDKVTHQLHTKGFNPIEVFDSLPTPAEILGWRNLGGGRLRVGTWKWRLQEPPPDPSVPVTFPWEVTHSPAILDKTFISKLWSMYSFEADVAPDWQYRISYILSVDERSRNATPEPVAFPPPGDRNAALQAYVNAAKNHKDYRGKWGDGKEIVGVNNIGEITFEWGPGEDEEDKVVVQELWWWLQGLSDPFPLSKGLVSLNLAATESRPV